MPLIDREHNANVLLVGSVTNSDVLLINREHIGR